MSNKNVFTLVVAVCLAFTISAQSDTVKKVTIKMTIVKKDTLTKDTLTKEVVKKDTSWKIGGIINIAFSQTSLTNWGAGGQNAIGLMAIACIHANYVKGKISWLNSADLEYGFQKQDNNPLQKSTDKIEVTSNLGYNIFDHTMAGILVDFKSQFAAGYQYPNNDSVLLSKFMAPGYLTLAAGLTYKPNDALSIFISPATLRYTFVEDQDLANAGDFGVTPAVYDTSGKVITPGKQILIQAGAYFKGDYSAKICKGINLTTDLSLFSDYLKNPQDIIVDWTTLIQMKVNKWISVTINTELIYDPNVMIPIYNGDVVIGKGPRTQFKDVSGVGLAYNF